MATDKKDILIEIKTGDTIENLKSTNISLNRLKTQLKLNKEALADMTTEEINNTKAGQELLKQNNAITHAIKQNTDATKAQEVVAKKHNNTLKKQEKTLKKHPSLFKKMGDLGAAAFENIGTAIKGAAIIKAISYIGESIKAGIEYTATLSKLGAVSGATAKDMLAFNKQARDLGAETEKSANEVANLQLELSKLGFKPKQIREATKAILDLSVASGEDLANSATIAAGTIKAFGLDAKDSAKVVDIMASSFSKSALDLEKFKTGMSYIGPAAKASNMELSKATAILGTLVDRNIEASSAGTGVRTMLLKNAKAGRTYEEGLDLISNSTNKLKTATELYGSTAANQALILADNRTSTDELTKSLDTSTGAATVMAKIMGDNLSGDMKKAQSATEEVYLSIFDHLEPVLRKSAKSWGTLLTQINSYIKASPADAITDEMDAVNDLFAELSITNLSEEERKSIIEELNIISPKLVEGLSSEAINLDIAAKNLKKYNEEAVNRIILAKDDVEIQKAQEEQAKIRKDSLDAEIPIRRHLLDMGGDEKKSTLELLEARQEELRLSGLNKEEYRNLGIQHAQLTQYIKLNNEANEKSSSLIKKRVEDSKLLRSVTNKTTSAINDNTNAVDAQTESFANMASTDYSADVYSRRIKNEKDFYKKSKLLRDSKNAELIEAEEKAINKYAEDLEIKNIYSVEDAKKSLNILKENNKKKEEELKEHLKNDKNFRETDAYRKLNNDIDTIKGSIRWQEFGLKEIESIHNEYSDRRKQNNKESNEELLKHNKDLNELLKSITKSTEITQAEGLDKDKLVFKEKQRLAKESFLKTLDNAGVTGEMLLSITDKFNKLQLAQNKEFEDKKAEDKKVADEKKSKDLFDSLSEEHEQIREIEDEFRSSYVEVSNKHYDDAKLLLEEHRRAELDAVVGHKELIKTVNEKYDKLDIKNSKDKLKAERDINAMRWQSEMDRVNAAADASQAMFAETAAGEKAALAVSKGAAIAQIWVSNAIANAKAVAAFPLTGGLPFTVINTTTAAIQTAGVVAQTARGMASISAAHHDKPKSSGKTSSNVYENGGVVGGTSYTGDNIQAFVNSNEVILNPRQQANILMDRANGKGGSGRLTEERVVEIVAQTIKHIPITYNSDTVDDFKTIENEDARREAEFSTDV